jgi:hypothetical protein
VGLRAGLDTVDKRKISYPYQESNPGRLARSPSLSRLSLRSSFRNITGKLEGTGLLASLSIDGSIILKWILEKQNMKTQFFWLRRGTCDRFM